jgi:Tfp pilus assembly protein PilO
MRFPWGNWEVVVKLLRCVVVGGMLVAAGQAFAQDDTAAQIEQMKAKLKQLEQRVDDEARVQKRIDAQTKVAAQTAYKAAPPDLCPRCATRASR